MTESKLKEVKKLVKERVRNIEDPQHGWRHLQRVANYAKEIASTLKVKDKIDIHLLQAACFLHDINHTFYSPGIMNYFLESRRLKIVLPGVLSKLDVEKNDKRIIESSIYSSPFSFPFKKLNKDKDLYTQILQDADTLDFFSKERQISFKKTKSRVVFYSFLGLFSKRALKYGRNNIGKFLNYPQLAKESYVQKS